MPKKLPLIALFGLPNSGKSTLLNRLTSTKKAIVAREAHTTRDLNYGELNWDGMEMQLVDTGGLVPDADTKIEKEIQVKSWAALSQADFLIWVIDRKQNPDTITDSIIQRVWKTGKPFMLVINKVDNPNNENSIDQYARLGGFEFLNVSAANGYGLNELLDRMSHKCEELGFEKIEEQEFESTKRQKRKRSKSAKVIRSQDGGYVISRETDEGGRPALFESYSTRTVVNEINSIIVDVYGVLVNSQGELISGAAQVLKSMVESGKKLYYISNTQADSIDSEEVLNTVTELFSGGITSSQCGYSKPNEKIYELLKEQYDLDFTKSLYVDDSPENIDAGTKLGMWTVLHNSDFGLEYLPDRLEAMEYGFEERVPEVPKIILLGKPNVGKSSLFNALSEKDLQIVTDIAGTTLSINDYLLRRDITYVNPKTEQTQTRHKDYILLDTTGIRKPGQRTFGAETFATNRTVEAAYEADVICLIVDGSQPLTHQDQVVAGIARQSRNGLVVIVNKADLLEPEDKKTFMRSFTHKFNFLKVDTFVWVSAKEKIGLEKIWKAIDLSLHNRSRLITRAEVRKLFNYLMKQKPPKKLRTKKRPIIYDLVYTDTKPPTFELLVKDKTTLHWSYLRFLENKIKDQFHFQATGIKLKVVEINRKNIL